MKLITFYIILRFINGKNIPSIIIITKAWGAYYLSDYDVGLSYRLFRINVEIKYLVTSSLPLV